jgi:hypothetical protein
MKITSKRGREAAKPERDPIDIEPIDIELYVGNHDDDDEDILPTHDDEEYEYFEVGGFKLFKISILIPSSDQLDSVIQWPTRMKWTKP